VQLRLARCPSCGDLDVTFFRPEPEATITVRWRFRKDGDAFVRSAGCDHLITDGFEVRSTDT
jgi:uncharacterized C2H2 Zn-finger protein